MTTDHAWLEQHDDNIILCWQNTNITQIMVVHGLNMKLTNLPSIYITTRSGWIVHVIRDTNTASD
jgi:hypothetical protein